MAEAEHRRDFTCKRISTGHCPVEWQSMEGSDICRTCGRCGALVFSADHLDSAETRALLDKFKEPDQKCLYRRPDGTLMLRRCGLRPNYSWTLHFIGWTGIVALFFLVVGYGLGMVLPPRAVFYVLYIWNVLGAFVLARVHLNGSARRAVIAAFLVPIVVIEVMAFTSLCLFVYWHVMFPRPVP